MTLSQRRTLAVAVTIWALIIVSMIVHPMSGAADGRSLLLAVIMLALPAAWTAGDDQ